MADGRVIIEIEARDNGLVRTLEQVRQLTLQAAAAISRQGTANSSAAEGSLRHTEAMRLQTAAMEQLSASARTAAGTLEALGSRAEGLRLEGITGQLTTSSAAARRWSNLLSGTFSQTVAGANTAASGMTVLQSAFARTASAANSMAAGLRQSAGAVQSAASSMVSGAVGAISILPGRFRQAAVQSGSNFASGLRQNLGTVTGSAQALGQSALTGITVGQAGFRQAGYSAATGYGQGISAGAAAVAGAATGVAGSARSAMSIGGWYGLGYNISAGVASGVRGGSGLISAAARSAAQSALNAAKRTLGVHSPSRVFRVEVGQQIPAGLAQGILDASPQAQRAVGKTARVLADTGRAALRPSGAMQLASSIPAAAQTQSVQRETQGPMVIETPVYLDGREIARASARYQGRRMAYLEGL